MSPADLQALVESLMTHVTLLVCIAFGTGVITGMLFAVGEAFCEGFGVRLADRVSEAEVQRLAQRRR